MLVVDEVVDAATAADDASFAFAFAFAFEAVLTAEFSALLSGIAAVVDDDDSNDLLIFPFEELLSLYVYYLCCRCRYYECERRPNRTDRKMEQKKEPVDVVVAALFSSWQLTLP